MEAHERHAIFWLSAKIGAPADLDLEHQLNSVQPVAKTSACINGEPAPPGLLFFPKLPGSR
jgi:hypothetical protein